ncbi:VOC family protein [Actinoplanes ianthinogenes]|uniref:VOC family protein n=1 Tax=Actinoplanes ianthinogenes TaxID=122358 RepID=UPI0027952BE9|nr:VOC family protein [Actinoplanes ianthinogenes]
MSRAEASAAVLDVGWRFLLGRLQSAVPVPSLATAVEVAAAATQAAGEHADGHLRVDLRSDRVILTLETLGLASLTSRDVELAHRISAALAEIGHRTASRAEHRAVQMLEIAIDARDIAAIRPFWKAVLGYTHEPSADGPTDPIVDPAGQGPAVWFQRMTEPRPQRNRVHFDLCVPHDEAPDRIAAAVAAGGRLVSERRAPAFWILADVEGNEICVTTWQGRD